MPSVSQKQHNFFEFIAHNPAAAKQHGVSTSLAREFLTADKKSANYKVGRARVGTKKKGNMKNIKVGTD